MNISNTIKDLLREFSEKPIAYHSIYARITGSLAGGVLLSQIIYWWFAMKENEFYKANKDFISETGMSVREFNTAKKTLKEKGFISVALKGVPRQSYYTVHIENVAEAITTNAKIAK